MQRRRSQRRTDSRGEDPARCFDEAPARSLAAHRLRDGCGPTAVSAPGRERSNSKRRTLQQLLCGAEIQGGLRELLQPPPTQAHSLLAFERILCALHGGPHVGKLDRLRLLALVLQLRKGV